jgi:cytoskeletal protein CcmA (bactofilin family)
MKDTATIAAGSRIIGNISASEDLIVHGRVEGRIQSEATVIIEAAAIVEADILANQVVVRGIVVGDIQAVEGIEIAASGQVAGDLRARRLTLRAGGRVAGQVASGVEVQGFSTGFKAATRSSGWQSAPRPTPPASVAEPASGWPADEVVESAPRNTESGDSPRTGSRRGRKEPSREVI